MNTLSSSANIQNDRTNQRKKILKKYEKKIHVSKRKVVKMNDIEPHKFPIKIRLSHISLL